jgi:hypothetical protein
MNAAVSLITAALQEIRRSANFCGSGILRREPHVLQAFFKKSFDRVQEYRYKYLFYELNSDLKLNLWFCPGLCLITSKIRIEAEYFPNP